MTPHHTPFVTIPLSEYQRMSDILNKKQDIRVKLQLTLTNIKDYSQTKHRYEAWPIDTNVRCSDLLFISNETFKQDNIEEINKMIEDAVKIVTKQKDAEIRQMEQEIATLKSKWHYKLFNW